MPIETEIKLRLKQGAEEARALLERNGYRAAGPRVLESDQAFDLPDAALRNSDRLLRLRSSAGRWTLTYKGPAHAGGAGAPVHKNREEIEVDLSDGPALVEILAALGYRPSFCYEKFRTKFKAPGHPGLITLDETPIGDFLELEGPGDWIDQAALRLGFHPADYITASYAALYEEYRQKHGTVPNEMRFHRS